MSALASVLLCVAAAEVDYPAKLQQAVGSAKIVRRSAACSEAPPLGHCPLPTPTL